MIGSALLSRGATPHAIAGWDELASIRAFYVGADWLRYADAGQPGFSRYLGLHEEGRLVAALSSHWRPDETAPEYIAERVLGGAGAAGRVLTLGGTRGFLSDVMVADHLPPAAAASHIAELIDAATAPHGGGWWWPYLPAPAVDVVLTAAERLEYPLGVHLVGADCVIDLPGATVDDHIAALPTRQRRTNFRRERKRFIDSGLEMRHVRLSGRSWQMAPLLAAVQRKHGNTQSAEEVETRLRRQAEHLEDRGLVFACYDGDRPVGFALAYRWNRELTVRAVGLDYDVGPSADVYAQVSIQAPLSYCYEHGLRRLHLGIDAYEAKCRRGARPRPLWAISSLAGAQPDAIAPVAHRVASSLPAHEAEVFCAEIAERCSDWSGHLSAAARHPAAQHCRFGDHHVR